MQKKIAFALIWLVVALLGAWAYFHIATVRHEPLNSGYILIAAICTYTIGYRFYSKWVAAKVLALNDRRATPCEVHEDGKDFVKTNKWIVFGHHFAAISGPGPLVGPVLAAQFGYLPGTLWILIGAVLGGCVQDFVILFASMRRDGKSLGQMLKDELNNTAGAIGLFAILSILIILLAVLALIVVNAMAESSWSVFTVGATIPIAMLMGGYLRFFRIGKVMEISAIGVVLLLLAVWGGKFVHETPWLTQIFHRTPHEVAFGVIVYGLAASILPVWLLLAPRDYLSTFLKLGTIFALVAGVLMVLPDLQMPAFSIFAANGNGLVVPGTLFPFCFITIACGAISGFHTLIASGITPKIITRETHARPVGYGAMLLESLVAIVAMIAACTLDPGVYMSMNVKGTGATTEAVQASIKAKVEGTGFTYLQPGATPGTFVDKPVNVAVDDMNKLAVEMGETTLFGRTGGAATLAVGMAQIFTRVTHGNFLDVWYHFALMFEAVFILTTIDAGTRVGRYLLQDILGHFWKPLGATASWKASLFASLLVVIGWGSFLIMGVNDPDGGVKALWPIFGIANQLLASIALCLATTIIIKMSLQREPQRFPWLCLVTIVPLAWLLAVTLTAGGMKVLHPKYSFFVAASNEAAKLPTLTTEAALKASRTLVFNNRVDGVVTSVFLVMVIFIIGLAVREWLLLIARKKTPQLRETEPVYRDPIDIDTVRPANVLSTAAIAFTLLKELSGEAAIEREQKLAIECKCEEAQTFRGRQNVFLAATNRRFEGVRRCC